MCSSNHKTVHIWRQIAKAAGGFDRIQEHHVLLKGARMGPSIKKKLPPCSQGFLDKLQPFLRILRSTCCVDIMSERPP